MIYLLICLIISLIFLSIIYYDFLNELSVCGFQLNYKRYFIQKHNHIIDR